MGKDRAELVVANAADESGTASQLGNPGQGVGGGAPGGFQTRAQFRVEGLGLVLIDQGHGSLGQAKALDDGIVSLDEHINDGVADADNVQGLLFRHGNQRLSRARLGP